VIGVGAQGGYDDAEDFVARHGITFRMLWDRGFDSWDGFAVWGTPASILVSRGGTQLKRWSGAMTDQQRADAIRLAREQG
jgi:hypothetical protein